ncbi:MAG TPA: uroporphyrinogen decarboxylase family protein [Dehalococcoidales bacterium]|nr:uroporphyrinogen decarboxylase family protein [Dehalococcoidales bacterium]
MVKETMTPRERIWAAVKLEPYDRVPVAPLLDVMFPARHKGLTLAEAFADYRGKGWSAMVDLFDDVGGWDGFILPGYSQSPNPGHPAAGRTGRMIYPGKGLPADSPPQYIETESMTIEDYDRIIKIGYRKWADEVREKTSPFPLEKSIAWAERQIAQYRKEIATWEERGLPTLVGASVNSPLMALSTSRSMTAFALDIHRIPDKVEAVMDAMVDDLIESTIEVARLTGVPGAFLVLERGGCFYFPLKVFERFEYPYVKKMVEAFVAEGMIVDLHFDQDWTLNLPYLLDLPAKMCICELDSKTDIFKAKEILKDHMCIAGDVPAGLQALGTPGEMEDYCKQLIDVVGKDTGFILSSGCTVAADCKYDNFKVMVATGRNYYPHG